MPATVTTGAWRLVEEHACSVMGTVARVVVVDGAPGLAARAAESLARLERAWSRFLDDSEVSACNRAGGRPVRVGDATRILLRAAVTGWRATSGAFDPSVLDAMIVNGYGPGGFGDDDRPITQRIAAPGLGGVRIDDAAGTVTLPPSVRFDPGGIGKGLAADLVTAELRGAGARGALVDVGGDIRVFGHAPSAGGWTIGVQHPLDTDRDDACLAIADGAVATSSTLGRRWTRAGASQHHVVDPSTGEPARGDFVAATVVAGAAWWAEVVATALLVKSDLAVDVSSVGAFAWRADGSRHAIGAMGRYVVAQEGVPA
ncbi:MAG TPA: FAD:protein FMN transferase [Acidimicrobiales bacterium]